MIYKCKICNTEHDDTEDAIDCHIACLLPELRKLYSYIENDSEDLKELIKLRKTKVLEYSKLKTDLSLKEDEILKLDQKITVMQNE